MSATITDEGKHKIVRLTGTLSKAEMDAIQWGEVEKGIPADSKVNVLVIAENFEGWQRGDEWGDVRFVRKYGDRIEKLAIVAAPRWEDQFMMFTGAGFRKTQVKFFPPDKIGEARAWLTD